MKEQVGALFSRVDVGVTAVVIGAGGAGASVAAERLVGFELARESALGFAAVAVVGAFRYFYEFAVDEYMIHQQAREHK